MTPVVGRKGPVRYRYYASHATTQGRHADAGSVPRVPAHDIEVKIVAELRRAVGDANDPADDRELIAIRLDRAVLSTAGIELHIRGSNRDVERTQIAWSAPRHRQQRSMASPRREHEIGFIGSTARVRLLSGIVKARNWVRRLAAGETAGLFDIAQGEGVSERSARMTLSLAFLAPSIVQAAIEGTLPRGSAIRRFVEPDLAWEPNDRLG